MPLEFVLVLGAFVNRPKQIRKCCFFALGVITFLEVVIIIITFTGIGTIETARELWPVLTLMESIQLPGSFIENQEVVMMAWWIMSVFMYISGGLYVSSILGSNICKFERENITALPLVPIVFLIAVLPNGVVNSYQSFVYFQGTFGVVFLFFVPLFMWIISVLRKVGGDNEPENAQ
ncbi:MAG: hypothetical protein BEN18_10025 [Epulopiscium sp. Nuni2H_MBin001]|nr:MAG: hypothetical protein BEN18_10025 [Epulopiscium sp. Nuni2H_MBin001]